MLVYIYKNVDNFFFVLGNKFQILAQEHSLNLFITLQFRHMKMENKKKMHYHLHYAGATGSS